MEDREEKRMRSLKPETEQELQRSSKEKAERYCRDKISSLFGTTEQLSARTVTVAFVLSGFSWVVISAVLLEKKLIGLPFHPSGNLLSGLIFVLLAALFQHLLMRHYSLDLSRSRKLLKHVFEASPGGIAVIRDQDQHVLLVNDGFCRMSGYDAEALTAGRDSDSHIWNSNKERFSLLRQLRNRSSVKDFDATFRHRDGSTFAASITASRINFDGEPCIISFIEDVTRQQQAAVHVEELTRYDTLTGLPNQKLLDESLCQHLAINSREGRSLALLTLSLGRCPNTISAMGHTICDELLRSVAMRIRNSIRDSDILAVLQKGEFGILFPRVENGRDLVPVVNKLLESISEPLCVDDAEFQMHAHIGIAIFPGDGRSSEVLLQHAHLAMTQAQAQEGENFFQFYSEDMNRIASEQLKVETSILRGIRDGEFFACYQPVFDRKGRQIVSMEALARWQHPSLGLVGPDKFIPVAEANGTIVAVGGLILDLALRNCQHWRQNGFPNLTVAVNVSARQLKERNFPGRVARSLSSSGLPPSALCCELTESILMEHSNENIEQLFKLKELGVRLAIDDFGTGYSSLAHLKHLPVDTIKIDRSFVRDLESNKDDKAIVSAIVAMARALRLQVVAEGVETDIQHNMLDELGCDYMQGFYFGKPMERDRFDDFLKKSLSNQPVTSHPAAIIARNPVESEYIPAENPAQLDLPAFQTVADITLAITPLQPCDRLNTALEQFQMDKSLRVLPVVDKLRVVGILSRSEFIEEQVVGRIGYAFHINHSKKVRDLMQPVPLVIDSQSTIEEASLALHGNSGTMRLENVCVARQGIYQGVLDVRTLVEAITTLNLKLAKGANPLTGLPGNESIQREITRRLESGLPFDIAYIDIDNFKPYNDYYGFERGDMVLKVMADTLKNQTGAAASTLDDFCGHIGGDDFIIITGPGQAEHLSSLIIDEFESHLALIHGEQDFVKGFYTGLNRKGELESLNLLSLSVAVISTGQLKIVSYAQLASMASEVKKEAKSIKGSSVVVKLEDTVCIKPSPLLQQPLQSPEDELSYYMRETILALQEHRKANRQAVRVDAP